MGSEEENHKEKLIKKYIVPQNVLALEGDPSSGKDKQHSPNMALGDVSEHLKENNTS